LFAGIKIKLFAIVTVLADHPKPSAGSF